MASHLEETHISSYQSLFGVLLALLALTGVTVFASTIDIGRLNVALALLIASVKGSFVALFFMHLKYESRFLKIMFIITLMFLAVIIGFIFWDVSFR